MYRHILVPTDGSPLSLKAAKEAAALAKTLKAKITAVYVSPGFDPPMNSESIRPGHLAVLQAAYEKNSAEDAAKALGRVAATAGAAKVSCEKVHLNGFAPWQGIIRAAKDKKCDVVVMASHGRSGLTGLLLGSETTKVLAHSKTPVLVCR